eukprot:TRINITY_DN91073_c0_g1_i1.p1 TRINITY_DN91073_c0_g1~~TRINITY_DN91073_c0_g1_i1.p1  ORF type:complete len:627 (+),score=116.03 TRINITY_DN91073_c0_g1_i1:52-1881(+)
MSLKLLQLRTRGPGGHSRGQRAKVMSLQEFQASGSGTSSSSTTKSVWGNGGTSSMQAGYASSEVGSCVTSVTTKGVKKHGDQSAWVRGPPTSAVDALWDAPPSADDLPETVNAWEVPATRSTIDSGSSSAACQWEGQPEWKAGLDQHRLHIWELSATESLQATQTNQGNTCFDIEQDITAWLKLMDLSEHLEAVFDWCEEMGAASLEEVVESLDDLIDALPIKPLLAKRLQNNAQEALKAVRARETPQPHDRGCELRVQSVYSCMQPVAVEQDADDEYVEQRPTETATWMPTTKTKQGCWKKQSKQRSSTALETAGASSVDEEDKRMAAQRRFGQQLQAEKDRRIHEAETQLTDALERSDSTAFAAASRAAEEAGMPKVELADAQQSFDLERLRRKQRRQNALCALRAALETPRDERFGPALQAALREAQAEGVAPHIGGGSEACREAEAAYQAWELAEQRKEETQIALQLALRRREVKALQVVLSEARDAGLNEDSDLVAEAAGCLEELLKQDGMNARAGEKRWRVRLRVDSETGAGIELSACDQGYLVEGVEDFPGQDFVAGDVIAEINGHSLAGMGEDEISVAFGEHFAHGATLRIVRLICFGSCS